MRYLNFLIISSFLWTLSQAPADHSSREQGAPNSERRNADDSRPNRVRIPGFVIGGVNSTAAIRALRQLNGIPIPLLEERMRPGRLVSGALSDGSEFERSGEGFLGLNESLIGILAADNDSVQRLGLSHRQLAQPLLDLIAEWHKVQSKLKVEGSSAVTLRYPPGVSNASNYRIRLTCTKGFQPSPFGDVGMGGSCGVSVTNISNGRTLETADMVPQMIQRYGFYEGKGTTYRLPPERILEVFDYLRP